MGLLDKAKGKFGSSFGDETVRVVNYKKPVPVPTVAEKKSERAPEPVESDSVESPSYLEDTVFSTYETDPWPTPQAPSVGETLDDPIAQIPTVQVVNNKIQDVLEVLNITPTFSIPKDVLLPEDTTDISFDLQTPYGFEQGQVETFLEQVKLSVKCYVDLLTRRNADVAKLATVVDRLQVDINNLRFQTEISHGINVLPTADNDELENKYMEAKLRIKKLEEQVRERPQGDHLTSREREKYEQLLDEFSLLQRKNDELEDSVFTLKANIAHLEELSEEMGDTALPNPNNDFPLLNRNGEESLPLPSLEETSLPAIEETSLPAIEVYISGDDGEITLPLIGDEDDDDALTALMENWRK